MHEEHTSTADDRLLESERLDWQPLIDSLTEDENVERITKAIADWSARKNETTRLQIERHSRILELNQWITGVLVLVAIVVFALGGYVFRDDPDIIRLLIVSFVSFLGGTAIGLSATRGARARGD